MNLIIRGITFINERKGIPRRATLKSVGALGALAAAGAGETFGEEKENVMRTGSGTAVANSYKAIQDRIIGFP